MPEDGRSPLSGSKEPAASVGSKEKADDAASAASTEVGCYCTVGFATCFGRFPGKVLRNAAIRDRNYEAGSGSECLVSLVLLWLD